MCSADADVEIHALEHFQKVEPHGEQRVVTHEAEGDGGMAKHVVQVGDEGPVAVIPHDVLGAVHDQVLAGELVHLAGNEDGRHHVSEAGHHDVQERERLGHGQGQVLVGEELDGDVDHPVGQLVRVGAADEHHGDAGVVQHEGARERLLVVAVGQHLEQQADQTLREFVLNGPKYQFLQERSVLQARRQSLAICHKDRYLIIKNQSRHTTNMQ